MKIIFVVGPPCCGKSVLCGLIEKYYNGFFIPIGSSFFLKIISIKDSKERNKMLRVEMNNKFKSRSKIPPILGVTSDRKRGEQFIDYEKYTSNIKFYEQYDEDDWFSQLAFYLSGACSALSYKNYNKIDALIVPIAAQMEAREFYSCTSDFKDSVFTVVVERNSKDLLRSKINFELESGRGIRVSSYKIAIERTKKFCQNANAIINYDEFINSQVGKIEIRGLDAFVGYKDLVEDDRLDIGGKFAKESYARVPADNNIKFNFLIDNLLDMRAYKSENKFENLVFKGMFKYFNKG